MDGSFKALHELAVIKYTSLRGSSYIPLPDVLKIIIKKKTLINIKNDEDMNVSGGAIWHTYFLLRKTQNEFENIKNM